VTELLLNRSFETDVDINKVPDLWSAGPSWTLADGRDCTVHKYGLCALKFTGTGPIQTLSFTALRSGLTGDKFKFSVWRRATAVPMGAGFYARVAIYNGPAQLILYSIALPVGTYVFTASSLAFTAPAAYTKLVVTLEYSAGSGTAWFDNASLTWTP
jgi:hypothetical protein